MCGIGRVTIAIRLLYWETRVPRNIRLIRVHGRKRRRIYLVNGSLRRNALLDTECAEFIKRVLEHPTLSSRGKCRAQARDHSVGDEVAIVQAVVIQDIMIPPHRSQLRLPHCGNVRMLLNKRRLTIAGSLGVGTSLGEALSLMDMRNR